MLAGAAPGQAYGEIHQWPGHPIHQPPQAEARQRAPEAGAPRHQQLLVQVRAQFHLDHPVQSNPLPPQTTGDPHRPALLVLASGV